MWDFKTLGFRDFAVQGFSSAWYNNLCMLRVAEGKHMFILTADDQRGLFPLHMMAIITYAPLIQIFFLYFIMKDRVEITEKSELTTGAPNEKNAFFS